MDSIAISFYIILIYGIFINLAGLISMKADKEKARRHAWRISEKMLFLIALLGGSIGSILGMHLFHHKTKHWYFLYGMPLIFCVQLLLIAYLIGSHIITITFSL